MLNRLGSVQDGTTSSDTEPDEQARQMSISLTLSSFEWHERKINLLDTPGRAELRRRRARRAARLRVGGLRDQRRDGRRGHDAAAVEGRRRARHRADAVRQHARPRARRLLPHARLAEGRVRPARRRDRDPDRREQECQRRDRPRRHAAPTATRAPVAPTRSRSRSPRRRPSARQDLPRAPDGGGRRGLRRADGALPRGRGDQPRGDRRRAQARHQPRLDLPRRVRRRDAQPRHQPPARVDRRRPALAGRARRVRDRARSRSSRSPTRELFAYVFKTRADPFAGRINLLRVFQGTIDPRQRSC